MTNFEYMKEKVLKIVSTMDEAELGQLISDACMSDSREEGIWDCSLCKEVYGDCFTWLDSKCCQDKYLNWCAEEYKQKENKPYMSENKEDILMRLQLLLKATRAGSSIEDMMLSEDEKAIAITF